MHDVGAFNSTGHFGPVASERLRDRAGELVAVPSACEAVYRSEPPRFTQPTADTIAASRMPRWRTRYPCSDLKNAGRFSLRGVAVIKPSDDSGASNRLGRSRGFVQHGDP